MLLPWTESYTRELSNIFLWIEEPHYLLEVPKVDDLKDIAIGISIHIYTVLKIKLNKKIK